jgi:hypothetical protein
LYTQRYVEESTIDLLTQHLRRHLEYAKDIIVKSPTVPKPKKETPMRPYNFIVMSTISGNITYFHTQAEAEAFIKTGTCGNRAALYQLKGIAIHTNETKVNIERVK